MVAKTLKSKLGAKLDSAVNSHKTDETKFNAGGDLPSGIDFGVAQLVEMKFGVYETGDYKGEFFFYAAGTVVSPKKATLEDGTKVNIEGMRTQIGPEPICDTPKSQGKKKTLDDHVAWVLNEMRKLGVDTSDLSAEDLESTAELLKSEAPFFKFRTWQGEKNAQFPNPRVNHDWQGTTTFEPEEASDAVTDKTAEAPKEAAKPAAKGPVSKGPAKAPAKVEETVPDEVPFGDNIDDLVGVAGDESNVDAQAAAQDKLNELALAAGATQEDIDATQNWEEVGNLIRGAGDEASATDEVDLDALAASAENGEQEAADKLDELRQAAGIDDEAYGTMSWTELAEALKAGTTDAATEPEWTPKTKEVYLYKPMILDPKKKIMVKSAKATEHEVTAVQTTTVSLKSLDTGKILIDAKTKKPLMVPWTDLEQG